MTRARDLSNVGSNITTTGIYQKQLTADGQGLVVKGSYTGNPNIFEVGQSASDGYAYVRDAVGNTTQLTGYPAGTNILRGRVTMPEQPAFYAAVDYSPAALLVNYGYVYLNTGNHFNAVTGLFTAPISARYVFHASVMTGYGYTSWYWKKNGSGYGDIHHSGNSGGSPYSSTSGSAVILLNAGDTLGVGNLQAASYTSGPNPWSSFSGYLLG